MRQALQLLTARIRRPLVATSPDLALVDVGLPKLDGYELARRVKQQLAAPPTLVAVTGYGQRNDRARALTAGFDDHMTKPVRAAALRALIEAIRVRLALPRGAAVTLASPPGQGT